MSGSIIRRIEDTFLTPSEEVVVRIKFNGKYVTLFDRQTSWSSVAAARASLTNHLKINQHLLEIKDNEIEESVDLMRNFGVLEFTIDDSMVNSCFKNPWC